MNAIKAQSLSAQAESEDAAMSEATMDTDAHTDAPTKATKASDKVTKKRLKSLDKVIKKATQAEFDGTYTRVQSVQCNVLCNVRLGE